MAYTQSSLLTLVVILSSLLHISYSDISSDAIANWAPGVSTWYGSPVGSGTTGGACGYGDAVSKFPFNSMVSAGGPSLYLSGKGCGACYQVKCTSHPACSGNPVTVTIIDECPGCRDGVHFDLSGSAFAGLAKPGTANQLRIAGHIPIQYKRVDCNYRGSSIVFKVDAGSNPFYLAVLVEFENKNGETAGMEALIGRNWVPMQHLWGATFKLNSGSAMTGPISLRVTDGVGRKVVAFNVIPRGWRAGGIYRSRINF